VSAAIDEAFSRFAEGTSTDHQQLRRAPWMTPKFIDPTRLPPTSDTPGGEGLPTEEVPSTQATAEN
jgi:hypothetical protein